MEVLSMLMELAKKLILMIGFKKLTQMKLQLWVKFFLINIHPEYNSSQPESKNVVVTEFQSSVERKFEKRSTEELKLELTGDYLDKSRPCEEESRIHMNQVMVSRGESEEDNNSDKTIEIDFRSPEENSKRKVQNWDIERISENTDDDSNSGTCHPYTITTPIQNLEISGENNNNKQLSDDTMKTQKSPTSNDKSLAKSTFVDMSLLTPFGKDKKDKVVVEISETEDYLDEFYYISSLQTSLKLGIDEIKQSIEEGKGFTYEYDQEASNKDPNSILQDKFYNHYHHCIQSVAYLSTLGDYTEDEFLDKKVYLPPKRTKKLKTLVLDLDETLVHCSENLDKKFDMKTKIKFNGGETLDCGVSFRPFAAQFLRFMSNVYEIVIFTASHSCYANSILNLLDPHNKYITFRMFRESCLETEENIFVKDLRIFANRKLKNLVLVDNACYSYAGQIQNGIPIVPYFEGKADRELLELAAFLTSLEGKSHMVKEIIEERSKSRSDVSETSYDKCEMNHFDPENQEIIYKTFLMKLERACQKYDELFDGNFESNTPFIQKISKYFMGEKFGEYIERFEDDAPLKLAEFFIKHVENFIS